jgi:hypothetical protein
VNSVESTHLYRNIVAMHTDLEMMRMRISCSIHNWLRHNKTKSIPPSASSDNKYSWSNWFRGQVGRSPSRSILAKLQLAQMYIDKRFQHHSALSKTKTLTEDEIEARRVRAVKCVNDAMNELDQLQQHQNHIAQWIGEYERHSHDLGLVWITPTAACFEIRANPRRSGTIDVSLPLMYNCPQFLHLVSI